MTRDGGDYFLLDGEYCLGNQRDDPGLDTIFASGFPEGEAVEMLRQIADSDGTEEAPTQRAREWLRDHGYRWTAREDYIEMTDEPYRSWLRDGEAA